MAMKLLDTFITTAVLYLIAYYGVLFRRKVILYDIDYRWM